MANHHSIKHVAILGLLLVNLSACTYLIPDDPSVPRYNRLIGERHRPERNLNVPDAPMSDNGAAVGAFTGAQNVSSMSVAPPTMTPTNGVPTPVIPVAESNLPPLPPVDSATQARAEREMAAVGDMPKRQVPVENSFELAQGEAPAITSVPPRPPLGGAEATQTRMDDVRRDLEHERATSRDMKAQLATDAANEPSLVGTPVPDRIVPSEQTGAIPTLPPAPQPPTAPVSNAAPYIAPPPPPVALNTLPPAPVLPAPERVAVQDVPPPQPAPELTPIRLSPPTGAMAATPIQFAPTPLPPAPAYAASGSSFDPLAASSSSARASRATYASSDYLPTSRYATKRN